MSDESPKYVQLDDMAFPSSAGLTDEWISTKVESLIARQSRDEDVLITIEALRELQRRRLLDRITIKNQDLGRAMIVAMTRATQRDLDSPEAMGEHLARALYYHGFVVCKALPPPLEIPKSSQHRDTQE